MSCIVFDVKPEVESRLRTISHGTVEMSSKLLFYHLEAMAFNSEGHGKG